MVAKKDKYVFAQVIRDVIEFLELDDDPTPELTPEVLAERYTEILKIAVSLVHQFPDVSLDNELPNRPGRLQRPRRRRDSIESGFSYCRKSLQPCGLIGVPASDLPHFSGCSTN